MRDRNHWAVHKDSLVVWTATVPIAVSHPEDLLKWTEDVVQLAEETRVAQFRRKDGSFWSAHELALQLRNRLHEESIVDAFSFSRGHLRTRSQLAYYERDGIVESMIDDAGALLADLRAPIDEDSDRFAQSCAPLWVFGHQISYGASSGGLSAHGLPSTSVEFSFDTDIWLPWVPGALDSDDVETFYDNRELAHRHSTRLNKFFSEVRKSCEARGGKWRYTNYTEPSWLDYLTGPDGIKLIDEPLPMSLAPWTTSRS